MTYRALETIWKKIDTVAELKRIDLPSVPYYIIVSADFEEMGVDPLYALAELLVNSDAMDVAAHGFQGTLCDSAVDDVWVQRDLFVTPGKPDVMTTWHDNEKLEDVIEYMNITQPYEAWGVTEWPLVILQIGDR